MTRNGKVTKKSNTAPATDPRAWVWQNYSEWVVFITTRSPGWHSRDKVDESTVTSCTFFLQQGQRGSKGSCLNHDHFEAPTSNYSLTWLRSIGSFLSEYYREVFFLLGFHPSLLPELLAMLCPMTHMKTAVSAFTFFSKNNYSRKALQYTGCKDIFLTTCRHITHTICTLCTQTDRLPQKARVSYLPKSSSSSRHFIKQSKIYLPLKLIHSPQHARDVSILQKHHSHVSKQGTIYVLIAQNSHSAWKAPLH